MSVLLGCPCGAGQHDTAFPTHNLVHIITDEDLDNISDYGADPVTLDDDRFDDVEREGWFCWNCGRFLLVEKDGQVRVFEEVGVTYKNGFDEEQT